MKATLDFTLPEEALEHEIHLKGPQLATALFTLRKKVFQMLDDNRLPSEKAKAIRELNEMIHDELEANGIEELICKLNV